MTVGNLYQDETLKILSVMAARPLDPEPPKTKASAWKLPYESVGDYVKSQLTIPRAVAAAGAEVLGNVMDTAGAFGQVAASVGGITPGFDPDASKNRSAAIDAMDRLKTEGIDWRTDESKQAYQFGRDLRPDPITAGAAENLVFSLTKGLTKAIGAAATLGPVTGAAAFGASEGLTTAEDLAAQGVDQATRTKAGAVAGVMNAAGMALPVAGKTMAQTAGLVVLGGPGSFMAQQAATREILRNADYKQLAEQYDPLDPMGLAVATLLPAGFAAYAKRGGFGAKPSQVPDAAPAPDNAAATQETVPAATPDAIDAAMVHNLTARADAHEDLAPSTSGTGTSQASVRDTAGESSASTLPEVDGAYASSIGGGRQDVTPDAYRARVDQLLTDQPDLVARLDESGQPVRLADELAEIKRQAQEGTDTELGALDAPLVNVAAECALMVGGLLL